MRYQKPSLIELGVRAIRAEGGRRRACVTGIGATGLETCATGPFAGRDCLTGTGPAATSMSCVPGGGTSYGDCFAGTGVFYACETGTSGYNDSYGCVSGPTYS